MPRSPSALPGGNQVGAIIDVDTVLGDTARCGHARVEEASIGLTTSHAIRHDLRVEVCERLVKDLAEPLMVQRVRIAAKHEAHATYFERRTNLAMGSFGV